MHEPGMTDFGRAVMPVVLYVVMLIARLSRRPEAWPAAAAVMAIYTFVSVIKGSFIGVT